MSESIGLLWLDDETRQHLVIAITDHIRSAYGFCRKNAVAPPEALRVLLRTLAEAASHGPERPEMRDEHAIRDGLLVGYSEAAQALGVSVRSLRRRVAAGQVRPVPWGRRRLFLVDDLRRLSEQGVA
jgi:hypothetical protein